ncbi:MAG TPA: glycosyltransferase family 4 protein [Terriglobales bacterium]|nr:glycosyltransferase family 4 protein [Terriglobales bacterium]
MHSKKIQLPLRILVDSLADEGLTNAQMTNGREIIRRLDPVKFHVSTFYLNPPDPSVQSRPNTRLIHLPKRRQTIRILREFIFGQHDILFYMKAAPASKFYLRLRQKWKDDRITIGTIESQSDVRNEPTISPEGIRLWEQTILHCDFLFSNSQAVKRSLQSEYGLFSEVVETGVDTKFFTPGKERQCNSRTRVLFAGSLRPFKQPHLMLEAALRFPQADFAIAGGGIMAEELREAVQAQNLANVFLLGPLSTEALRKEYQRADVFLFPSKWEGSPKVILEAAASGLPVIARRDYNPETVIDGETGFVVECNDELFARLRELLDNAELRNRLGSAGRLHSEKFDWDLITRKWESIFLRLASDMQTAA